MNQILIKKLYDEFPELFKDKDSGPQETCLYFGIETDDGWYKLIRNLCHKIYKCCNKNNYEIPTVIQVKEKYGSLRFYINSGDEKIYNIIDKYENKSFKICEICGKRGRQGRRGWWIKTLCKKHRKDLGYTLTQEKN